VPGILNSIVESPENAAALAKTRFPEGIKRCDCSETGTTIHPETCSSEKEDVKAAAKKGGPTALLVASGGQSTEPEEEPTGPPTAAEPAGLGKRNEPATGKSTDNSNKKTKGS